jgi:subtilisin
VGLWRVALVALVITTVLPRGYVAAADPPARYIVVFRDRVDPRAKTDDIERRLGFTSDYRYTAALRGFAAQLSAAQLALLRADPDVATIAADRIVRIADAVPIKPGDTAPTGVRRMNAATTTTAHAASTVNVAVIDSGIYLQHRDLNAVHGKNCINPGQQARDDNGHGTHVAGTIAAKNNGSGVIGVAPGTKVYAVKVINAQGSGTDAQVVCGIDWVTANASALNIRVANVSLGGDGTDDGNCGFTNNDVVHQALCRSVAAGVMYVVAAGNSGQDLAANYPASYDEVLTVTAMADTDGRPGGLGSPTCLDSWFESDDAAASFSNFTTTGSPDAAHTIAGAGVCITSTRMGGGTAVMSGTSMATPHVAGIAALCLGEASNTGPCTGLTPVQIGAKLRQDAAGAMASFGFAGDPGHPIENLYFGHLAAIDPPRDTTAPVISAIAVGEISDSGATVSWTTDEAADSRVDYGTTSAYGLSSASATLVTGHEVRLSGLAASTTYHYRVRSADGASNVTTSTDRTFSTIAASSDLALTAAPLPASVDVGATLRYRLSATNGGPSSATAVQLADTLPQGTTLVSASTTQGSCTTAAQSVSCAIGTLVPNPVLRDGPAGYWRLGEPAGADAASDAAGTNTGTYSGVTLEAPGAVPGDSAASFGGSGVVSIPAASALDLSNALSVEAWVKPAVAGVAGGIFEKTIGGAANTQYLLFLEGGAIKFRGALAGGGHATAGGPVLAVGSWSHVVGTHDGTTLRIYVNGALVASAGSGALAAGSGAALIGRLGAQSGSPSLYPFSGVIDEVAIYASALSAARVLAHFTNAQTNVTTARVSIDVRVDAGGTLVNSAQLSANEPDPSESNNSVSQSVTSSAASSDLALTAAPLPASVDVGATLHYRLSATNGGPSSATAVQLADTLPQGTTLVSASTTQGSCTTAAQSVSCAIGTLVPNPVLRDGPAGYWRLGEPAGADAASDAAGTNTGTYSGVTLEAPGAVPGDSAASFGGSGVVSIPAASALDLSNALSVEAWVKPAVAGVAGGIFEKTIGGAANTQYLLFLEGGAIKFRGALAGGGHATAGGPVLAVGSWSHVVGTHDGTTLRIYVNGALVASAGSGALAAGSGAALIGRLGAQSGSPSLYPFSGVIDEVAIYASALSAARVLAHFTNAQTNVTTARVSIDVRVTAAGTATASVQVSASETDLNPSDNTLGFSTVVN